MLADQALHKTMLLKLRSLSAVHYAHVLARRDAYGEVIRSTISACQDQGALTAAIDAQLLCLLLLNLLNWTIFWYRPDGIHSPDAIADATVRTLLNGWRSPVAGALPPA